MPHIKFYNDNVQFVLKAKGNIRKWLLFCASKENKTISSLSYIFCSDDKLLEINQKFLNHNTFTDTITFEYSDGKVISGDVFISIERVLENSMKFHVVFEEEMRRVIIHGFLHLCGYSDKKAVEKVEMKKKENTYLKLYRDTFHVKH
jgi:probable rRNA maturation factor